MRPKPSIPAPAFEYEQLGIPHDSELREEHVGHHETRDVEMSTVRAGDERMHLVVSRYDIPETVRVGAVQRQKVTGERRTATGLNGEGPVRTRRA